MEDRILAALAALGGPDRGVVRQQALRERIGAAGAGSARLLKALADDRLLTIDDDSGDLRITAAGLARTTPPTAAAAPPLDSGIAAARCALPTADDGPARAATAAAAMAPADPVAAPALGTGLASAPQPPPQATWPMPMMDAARPAPIPAPGTEPVMGRPGQTTGRAKPKPS